MQTLYTHLEDASDFTGGGDINLSLQGTKGLLVKLDLSCKGLDLLLVANSFHVFVETTGLVVHTLSTRWFLAIAFDLAMSAGFACTGRSSSRLNLVDSSDSGNCHFALWVCGIRATT